MSSAKQTLPRSLELFLPDTMPAARFPELATAVGLAYRGTADFNIVCNHHRDPEIGGIVGLATNFPQDESVCAVFGEALRQREPLIPSVLSNPGGSDRYEHRLSDHS
ncbi:MAG: hypothetical protein JWO84_676 [Parcubacteria group bacterium]|nr:hypothetical protein [Parcubacteria group bacterium]